MWPLPEVRESLKSMRRSSEFISPSLFLSGETVRSGVGSGGVWLVTRKGEARAPQMSTPRSSGAVLCKADRPARGGGGEI